MRSSYHTAYLSEYPVLEAVARVLDAGYDEVELNAETLPTAQPHVGPDTASEVRRALAATGPYSSIAAHRAGLASPDDALRRAAVQWTIGCGQLAADVGCDLIHVIPGDEAEGSLLGVAGGPGDLPSFVQSLDEVVTACEPLGVRVSLEPIVNQLVSDTDGAENVLRQVPGLGISFDPSHLQVTTHDVTGAAKRLGARVYNAALKDGVGSSNDFTFPGLGEGDIDFVAMLRALRDEGFDGAVSVEHEAHLFGDTRPPLQVLEESFAFVDDLLRRV